jgi:tetratricopeptide (TPR) repeat protein
MDSINKQLQNGLPSRYSLLLPALLVTCLLTACASSRESGPAVAGETVTQNETSGSSASTNGDDPAQEDTKAEPDDIDYGQFSEEVLTRTIMAELAMQRGQNDEALEEYTALAKETRNISIIQRAMRLATFLRNAEVSLELGELWLQQEPESVDARQMLAIQLVLSGRYREAMDHMIFLHEKGEDVDFRLIPSRTVNDASAPLILDALITDFLDLRKRFPDSRSIGSGLAMLYEQNQQLQEAYEVVAALAKAEEDDPELVIQEVQLLEKLGDDKRAQQRLQQSLRDNPQHKQLRFMYGRKLIDEHRYPEAKEQFTILVEQDPRDFDMVYSLALLSMEVAMFDDARAYWQRLVLNGQKLDEAHFYLGFIYNQEKKPDEAIEHYLQVKGGNNFLMALRNLTELMVKADRYPEVHAHLQNIRFRSADYNIPLLSMEANVLVEQDRYEAADELLNGAIGAFPNNIQLLFQRSVLYQEMNDLPRMEADLRRIILLDPSSPVAYNSLGYTLADRTERHQEAYELILKAVELAPNDPAIIDSLGWVQYKLGMYDDARKNLERAYELFPDPEVAAHLGEVLWVMGEKTAANRIWRSALEVQPDSEFILNAMERLNPGASR